MTDHLRPGAGIDPEMLAGYIDKRLTPEQRAAVEAQLAADPESYALLVETMKARDALSGALPDTVRVTETPVVSSRRSWMLIGAGLAAAAAIVLAVRMQQPASSDPTTAALQKLVAAAGPERYIEARVTGGFQFGPMRPVTRGPSDTTRTNLQFVAAAAELREAAQRDPSAVNLTAWGVAQLMLREYDGAVTTLTEAKKLDPSAIVETNLAAAYLSRGIATNATSDLAAALVSADAAVAHKPAMPEALYNRALVLERLTRLSEASATWQEYLKAEPSGPWAGEARARAQGGR